MSSPTSKPIAFSNADRYDMWHGVMHDKIQALHFNNTWSLVPFHPSMNVIGSRWVYRINVVWMAVLSDIRRVLLLEALVSKKALIILKLSVQLLSKRPSY
jgi:hypothetical protein